MYKIIIYKLIVFKKQLANNKTINKKYFQKIKTINNINNKELTKTFIDYKKIYKDYCYIFSILKENETDFYINNMNEKSYKDYIKYIESR